MFKYILGIAYTRYNMRPKGSKLTEEHKQRIAAGVAKWHKLAREAMDKIAKEEVTK